MSSTLPCIWSYFDYYLTSYGDKKNFTNKINVWNEGEYILSYCYELSLKTGPEITVKAKRYTTKSIIYLFIYILARSSVYKTNIIQIMI